jgi:hypothetical protein
MSIVNPFVMRHHHWGRLSDHYTEILQVVFLFETLPLHRFERVFPRLFGGSPFSPTLSQSEGTVITVLQSITFKVTQWGRLPPLCLRRRWSCPFFLWASPPPHESWHKLKLIGQAINVVSTTVPKYLHWSESSITFDRTDHPDSIPKPGRFPLIVDPLVGTTQ